MKNATDTTQTYRSGYTHDSINPTQYHPNISHAAPMHDMSGTLGYGAGRILREAFDYAYEAWQGWWYPRSNVETITQHRQAAIYRQGLETVITQLDAAIENLRKNPRDPNSLERVKQIVNDKDYANYFKPAQTEKLHAYQARLFKPIHEKVQRFKVPRLKEIVQGYLSALQTEITPLTVDSTLSNPTGTLDTQIKRSIAQQPAVVPIPAPMSAPTPSASFENPFNLTTLNGSNGFQISGLASNSNLGISVSTAGDINGDGIADLVMGAYGVNGAGAGYVIFGQGSGFPANFNVTTLNGANGFQISGLASNSNLGISVSTAGDINGDGIADLVIGADGVNSYAGAGYVIFGQGSGFPANFNVTTLNGANGFQISGLASNSFLGTSVSTAGDINGDGIADLVIGAISVNSGAGAGYVIFGQGSGFPANFNVTTLNGANGFQISGLASSSYLGISVSTVGDLNGDGKTDLVIGAYGVNSNAGAGYVIFGQGTGFNATFDVITLNGANGFQISGLASNSNLGISVSTAGDLNGDGKADLLIGAYGVNNYAGAGYVIFGQGSGFPANFNVTTLNGANGFQISGLPASSDLGYSVSTAGDINGDGKTDLLIGAYGVNSNAGAGYVIFGQGSGFPANFNVTTLNGTNGFQISGSGLASNSYLGISVSTAGDINSDGIADLVIGAYAISNYAAGYVIFGVNVSTPIPNPAPIPTTIPIPAPSTFLPAPNPVPLNLTACPINDPLQWLYHDIIIARAQQLRLSPADIATSCGNATQPYESAYFTVTGIRSATLQQRNASGGWNVEGLTFFGQDLAAGRIALLQDGSNVAPQLNISASDRLTTLPDQVIQVNFTLTDNTPVLVSFQLTIPPGGSIILTSSDIVVTTSNGKLSDVIISVENIQNGYFVQIDAPNTPITEFTYYQIQTGQIQLVHTGGNEPISFNITVGDGLKSSIPQPETVTLFGVANNPVTDIGMIAGVSITAGVIVAGGLAAFGFYRYTHQQREGRFAQLVIPQGGLNEEMVKLDKTNKRTPQVFSY